MMAVKHKMAVIFSSIKSLLKPSTKKDKAASDLFKRVLISQYTEKPATVVQIGVCDGRINDPIYEILRSDIQTNTIILIEPQSNLNEIIGENYSFHGDTRIVNCAIGHQGQISLYRLAEKYHDTLRKDYLHDAPSYRVPAGFVSGNRNHVINHVQGKLGGDTMPDDAIEEFSVECKSLLSVLQDVNVDYFDVLQIDCEGMDDTVLYNCNLDQFKPAIINFEHMHLSQIRRESLVEYLENIGYNINVYSHSDTLATTLDLEGVE